MQEEPSELARLKSKVARLSALVAQYRGLVDEAEAAKQTIERLRKENGILLERLDAKDVEIAALRQKADELQKDNQDLHSLARDALEQNEQLMVKLRLADSRFDRALGGSLLDLTEAELSAAVPTDSGKPARKSGEGESEGSAASTRQDPPSEENGEAEQGLSCTAPEVSLSLTDGAAGMTGSAGSVSMAGVSGASVASAVSIASVEHVPLVTADF